jgi:peptidoglycan/LPS O-acetylase OafA/YrhL
VRVKPLHWPALDGVRALAVVAVVVYHARPGWLRGGFLGVDVFFVLSGFLITALLLREHHSTGRVALRAFWTRRARRLLPALHLLLAAVLAWEVLLRLAGLADLRWDALAALGWANNWLLVLHQQSYFASFAAPDALQHLWSLAVEEQFYLLWPLVVLTGLLRGRRALLCVLLAVAGSTAWCALAWNPGSDPSRVYFGTDTHSAGLLVGALLAVAHQQFWPRVAKTPRSKAARAVSRRRARLALVAGLAALAGVLAAFVLLDETQPLLYRGGLTAVALCTAVLLGVLLHPLGARLAAGFAWAPLRWVGTRSYGIYLWHWPVLVLTSPHGNPGDAPLWMVGAQVSASVLLAWASYRWVEQPVRSGAAWRALRGWWAAAWRGGDRGVVLRLAWGGGLGAVCGAACALVVAVAATGAPALPSYQGAVAVHLSTRISATAAAAPAHRAAVVVSTAGSPAAAPPSPTAAATARPSLPPPRVTAIGDSVMLGAAPALARAVPNLDLDAKVGRQMSAALDILRSDRASGRLGDVVVMHMGNNGVLTAAQLHDMMSLLAGVPRVVLVNDKVPRPWQDPNDAMLQQLAHDFSTVRLVDWRSASQPHPEFFWDDATHLRPDGASFYAKLVAAQVPAVDPIAAAAAAAAAPPPAPASVPSPTPIAGRVLS